VFAAPFGNCAEASIAVTIEIEGRGLSFVEQNGLFADDVEISVIAIDRDAKIKDGGRDVVQLKLKPQTREAVARAGIRISRRLELPPGNFQLRVGVRDGGTGATGSVLYDLVVPDFPKDALSMSGILIASAVGNQMPTANLTRNSDRAAGAPDDPRLSTRRHAGALHGGHDNQTGGASRRDQDVGDRGRWKSGLHRR
jgi:hypothetical protein